eukprot:4265987-Pyramimonas_sp.AAC.1
MVCFVKMHVLQSRFAGGIDQTFDADGWKNGLHGQQGDRQGLAPMVLHPSSGNVVIVTIYLWPGFSTSGHDQSILISLGAFLSALADPWIVVGDWNLEPTAFLRSGWPSKLQGEVLYPDVKVTCDKAAQGTLIDYGLVKQGTTDRFRMRGFASVPWKTHIALQVDTLGSKQRWWHQRLVTAPAFPTVRRPKKQADPSSKASIEKQEALMQRRARPPEDLQAEFDLLHQAATATAAEADSVSFYLSEEVWPSGAIAVPPLGEISRRTLKQHFLGDNNASGSSQLTSRCNTWITKMEMASSVHHQQEDFEPLRGAGSQLKWQLSQAAPGRPHLSDPVGEQWGIVHTPVLRTASLAKHGRDPKRLSDCCQQLQRHVAHFQSSDTADYFGTSGQEERDRWL